ncbi:MAG: membrane protein insertion efficiency factor YidD [Actinomycetes bacterium]
MTLTTPQPAVTSSERLTTKTQQAMLRAIRWYQSLRPGYPSKCRFFPSCSEYGHEAIEVFGARRGGLLTARRLLRCRPFGPSGFDPIPLPNESTSVSPTVCCTDTTKDC